jgi:D-sedoheptulose 7-phosphate isomerase
VADDAERGLSEFGQSIASALARAVVTSAHVELAGAAALNLAVSMVQAVSAAAGTIFFVGNGGSAAIASHCAADYAKNGGFRALALHDPAALTCFANDLGYDQAFSRQLLLHGRPGDLLFAISSSGQSANILAAAQAARERSMHVIALSGFAQDNPLRAMGVLNFYVPCNAYGVVEIAHLAICHAVLDRSMGNW